jgi:hypothetical protein
MLKSFDGQGDDTSDIAYVPRNATKRHSGPEWGGCAWSFEARGKYLLVEACDRGFQIRLLPYRTLSLIFDGVLFG